MKYEKGDKVVVEIGEMDVSCLENNESLDLDTCQFLGKLEDFTESKKIKMTVEEKKEFDNLLERFEHSTADLNDLLDAIWYRFKTYPDLRKKLFENAKAILNRKKQFEFARALENPDLIEVEKPKKYYVHLIPDKPRTYLGYERIFKTYSIGSKDKETHNIQMKFTKDEIKNFDLSFEIKPEALEEVPEDE